LGCASLAVAPTPVALAICLVAATGPLLAGRPAANGAASKSGREVATLRAAQRSDGR
jgi:hypothetical protein